MIYFAITVVFASGLLLARNTRAWMFVYWSFCGLLILLAGLRWETGTDWLPYSTDFVQPGVRGDFEIGYVLLVRFVSYFTTNYTIFLLFTALVSTTLIFYVCWKISEQDIVRMFATVLVFYGYYFLGSWLGAERRQYSIALCFFSLIWIKRRQPLLFLSTVGLAGLFHVSSLIFLPAYWIYRMKRKHAIRCVLFIVAAGLGIMVVGSERLVETLLKPFSLGFVSVKILAYLVGSARERPPAAIDVLFGLAKRLVILLVFWIVWRKRRTEDIDGFLKLYVVSVVLYIVSTLTVSMFSVMTIYYSITEVLLIPMTLMSFRLSRSTLTVVMLVYALIQASSILRPYWPLYVPYYSVIDHVSRQVIY